MIDDGEINRAEDLDDAAVSPADVASAGRSCSVILVVAAVTLLLVCVATTLRIAFGW